MPEARRLFSGMTVRENVLMGAFTRRDKPAIAEDYDACCELFPRLRERSEQLAGTLSGGEQQMVAMARALMGRPRLICMDEPTMGLSPPLRRARSGDDPESEPARRDHLHGRAECAPRPQIADYGYVLQTGRIVLSGPARDLLHDPRIRDAYLGGAGKPGAGDADG